MNLLDKKIKRLLYKSSRIHLFILFSALILALPLAFFVRQFVLFPVWLEDIALAKDLDRKFYFVCTLPFCKTDLKAGDFILFEYQGTSSVRKIIAVPGDSLKVQDTHVLSVNKTNKIDLSNENILIADREWRIPEKADTLFLDSLSDIEFDYALNILKQNKKNFFVRARPFTTDKELPSELAGKTKIGSRPVSLKEIPGLPWSELYLIAHQIHLISHTNKEVFFKREAFNTKDSSKIDFIVIQENLYYVLCSKTENCRDSRELGYISEEQIVGKLLLGF